LEFEKKNADKSALDTLKEKPEEISSGFSFLAEFIGLRNY